MVQISRQDLSTDLRIVRSVRRAMDVNDRARITVDEGGRFHRLDGVVRPVGVFATCGDPIEPGGVDRLHVAELPEVGGEGGELPPIRHVEALFGVAYGQKVGKGLNSQLEPTDDARHFLEDIHQLPVGMGEMVLQTVQSDNDPISVAAVTLLHRRPRRASRSFFGNRHTLTREVGECGSHNQLSPFTHRITQSDVPPTAALKHDQTER